MSQSDPNVDGQKLFQIKKSWISVEKSRILVESSKHDTFTMFRRRSFDARRSRLVRNVKSAGCFLGVVVRQLLECVYCLWIVSNACLMCGVLL